MCGGGGRWLVVFFLNFSKGIYAKYATYAKYMVAGVGECCLVRILA